MPNETLAEERARLKRETKALGKNLEGLRKPAGKVKPKKKKLTAAQITAIRNKPVSQRTMSEVRMIMPNAVNKLGHTQAEFDRISSGVKQVNEARAAGMGLRKLPDLTEREKALKEVKDRAAKEKANKEIRKKATGDAVYKKYVNQYQREEDRTGFDKKADTFFDKVGDKVRGSAVGKYAKSKGMGTFSRDDEAQMQARKDIKGYKTGGKIRGAGIAKKGIRACKIR